MKKLIPILLVAMIAGALGWFLKPSGQLGTVKETKTITIPGDSIPYPVTVAVPVPHDSIITDTFWREHPVDTAEILRRYFARYIYQDTIRDTSFLAILHEVISQNRIVERDFKLQNLRPQAITYTTTITSNPSKWHVGPAVSFGSGFGFGGQLLYVKNKNAYVFTCDLFNRNVGIAWLHSIK